MNGSPLSGASSSVSIYYWPAEGGARRSVQYGGTVTLAEDLFAKGEPEREFNPGIAGRSPRRRVAGGALIRDQVGRVLFVVPGYKPFLASQEEWPMPTSRRLPRAVERSGRRSGLIWPARGCCLSTGSGSGRLARRVMFIFDGGQLDEHRGRCSQADRH